MHGSISSVTIICWTLIRWHSFRVSVLGFPAHFFVFFWLFQDFHRDLAALSEQLLPQHNYKLDANAMTARHFGELECREYRASILHAALPHRWDHNADTHFRLASFHRHRR